MFEIVKKCKISLPTQDQLSGERYRAIGPLVFIWIINTKDLLEGMSIVASYDYRIKKAESGIYVKV